MNTPSKEQIAREAREKIKNVPFNIYDEEVDAIIQAAIDKATEGLFKLAPVQESPNDLRAYELNSADPCGYMIPAAAQPQRDVYEYRRDAQPQPSGERNEKIAEQAADQIDAFAGRETRKRIILAAIKHFDEDGTFHEGAASSEPPKEDSGVGLTRSGKAVEAERRQDQAEPCNTALPSTPKEERGEWTEDTVLKIYTSKSNDLEGMQAIADAHNAALADEEATAARDVANATQEVIRLSDALDDERERLIAVQAAIEKHNKDVEAGWKYKWRPVTVDLSALREHDAEEFRKGWEAGNKAGLEVSKPLVEALRRKFRHIVQVVVTRALQANDINLDLNVSTAVGEASVEFDAALASAKEAK